jgi:hypothetical protein
VYLILNRDSSMGSGLLAAPGPAGYTARAGEMGNLVGEAG